MAKGFTYKMEIDADVNALTGKLKTLKDALASVISDGKEPKIAKILDQLGARIDNIKTKAATPVKSEAAFASMEKEIQSVQRLLEGLGVEISNVGKKANTEKISFLPEAEQKKLLAIVDAMKKYDSAIDTSTKKSKELLGVEKKLTAEEGKLEAAQKKLAATKKSAEAANRQRDIAKDALDEAKARQDAAKAAQEQYEKILKIAEARKKEATARGEKIDLRSEKFDDGQGGEITLAGARGKVKSTANAAAADDMNALADAYKTAKANADALNTSIGTQTATVEKYQNSLNLAKDKVEDLTKAFDANKLKASNDAFNDLRQAAKDLGVSLESIGADNTPENIDLLKQRMEEFVAQGIQPVNEQLQQATSVTEEYRAVTEHASETNRQNTETFREQNEAAGEISGLMDRIKQFTGLTGAAILMRKALQNAFQTIKELDKQMTEMAVVTDLQVGDYWKQLPEHTERANALGMAIKDVYQAETLYYQQGLKTAQVTALSTSTLKMARIAGLGAEDATNKMTAALRGFNMEINETNADRVADVYSKLAAITASNVNEISSAMTKTASIASNAGMEFETTAAFLSQIIETTRESAETAGTALKTVIARFQELKKSPEEIGEVDGEIVDANKIETALRSVGVALRDASGQFRDLDDVFIELASKWDTLDMNTQRYIATIAAGSRQQSRFVAMMSNYARTQELVNAANNAAGASNEQFAKTLESLESKLAALKNAWDTLTMGLVNNEFIKIAIDILTSMLDAINKITEGFGPWSSSALKIGLVTAALIAGDKALKIFMASMRQGNSILTSTRTVFTAAGKSITNFGRSLVKNIKNLMTTSKATWAATSATQAYQKAEKAMQHTKNVANHANEQLAKSEAYLSKLKLSGKATNEELAKAEEIKRLRTEAVARANQNAANAQVEFTAAMGLSEGEMATYNGLLAIQNKETGKGISADTAFILTKNRLNASNVAQMASIWGVTEAQAAERMAEELGNATGLKAIIIKANWTIQTWMKTAADKAETGGIWAKVAAYIAETIAAVEAETAMAPLLIITLLLTAAILALVAAIFIVVALVKVIKANTLEGQIDAQKEKVKQYNEVLESSKKTLDDLREAHEKYKDLQDTYKNLTKGTKEWRQALLDANKQVLELIQTYPQLAQYLKRDGELLTITEEGWDAAVSKQEQAVNLNTAASLGAQAKLSSLTTQKETRDYYDKYSQEFQSENFLTVGTTLGTLGAAITSLNPATILLTAGLTKAGKEIRRVTDDWGAFGTIIQGVHTGALLSNFTGLGLGNFVGFAATIISQKQEEKRRKQTQDFAAAMLENGLSFEEMDKGAVQDLYKSIFDKEMTDEIYEAMADSSDALFALGESTLAARAELDAFAGQMVSNALDMANITNEWRASLQGFGAGVVQGSDVEGNIEDAIKELQKSMDQDEAMRKYAELTGQFYQNGKVYTTGDIAQQTEDTQVKVSTDIMWEVLAQNKLTAEAATRLDSVSVELQRAALTMSKTDKERAKRILANDASALTSSDLAAIQAAGDVQTWLKEKGINIDLSADELSKITESIDNANKDAGERREKLSKATEGTIDASTLNNITDGLTGLGIQGLTTSLQKITENFGAETAASVATLIEDFGTQLSSPELREAFNAQIASADWSSTESFTNLTEILENMADVTDEDRIVLQTWSEAMGAATHALTTVNLDAIRKQVASLNSTIKDMFEGNRNLDDEAYQNLIDMGFSEADFQKTAEGFRYLGQTGDLMRSASEAAYKGVAAANANFAASQAETEHSLDVIATLEAEIANHANDRRESAVKELSATEALWLWVKEQLAKIRDTIVAAATWLYDNIIHPMGEFFAWLFGVVHDFFVKLYNEIGKTLSQWYTDFCNVFIQILNGLIDFYNNVLGQLFGEIDRVEYKIKDFQEAETMEQKKRREELARQQEKLAQQIEADTENLQKVAEAYAQAADSIDIGILRTAQEDYAKLYEELVGKMNAATSETVRNAYKKEIDALQIVLDNLDKSLMSKALAYEDLAPDVQRFQEALKRGNTEVAEDLRQKLANAIASKDAAKRLSKAFTQIGEELENVLAGNLDPDALYKQLEQWSYVLGFDEIDQGVQLLANHFDLLGSIIEGDEEAWKSFQKAMLEDWGFHIDGDIDLSEINTGLISLGAQAQNTLNSLLDTGAFKMQQITATSHMSVPNIVYDENGYPTIQGMIPVDAGQTYWQLVPSDFGDLEIEKKDLSGDKSEMWENPYGWLYNLNQLSDATIRKREDAEWKYQRALAASGASAKTLLDLLKEQVDADREIMALEQQRYDNAQRSVETLISKAPAGFEDYIHVGPNGQISTDSTALYSVDWTSDMGGVFEDWLNNIDEVLDEMNNAIDNLKDARDRAAEKKYTGRDEYGDLVNRIKDTFIAKYQQEIDVLSNINDAIEDASSKLVEKLQEKIDDDRKARDDAKALSDLEDKQTRLAYLQASGGSALEILKLQKEIENDTQSYQDGLVDDAISAMEKANDAAAEQRAQQIDIAQAQLDFWSENDSAAFAEAQLNEWLSHGTQFALEQVQDLLTETEGKNLSSTEMAAWKEDTENAVSLAEIWRSQTAYDYYSKLEEDLDNNIDTLTQDYEALDAGRKEVQNYVDENGAIQGQIGDDTAIDVENKANLEKMQQDWEDAKKAYKDAAITQYDASNKQLEAALQQVAAAAAMNEAVSHANDGVSTTWSTPNANKTPTSAELIQEWVLAHNLQEGDRGRWDQAMAHSTLDDGRSVLEVWRSLSGVEQTSIYGANANTNIRHAREIQALLNEYRMQPGDLDMAKYTLSDGTNAMKAWTDLPDYWKQKIQSQKAFATGGLADFTGPAWLDGTKSAPELVLNATDTANFIALKDILSEIMHGANDRSSDKSLGNNYYDIEVHVDSIDSDYDVDQAVERMKELIEADAMYRNVNAVQKTR